MPEITLLMHNIRSTYNVGAIMRTAEGFGVRQIIFSGYTPYPDLRLADPRSIDPRLPHITERLTAQIHKTALGAETMLPFSYVVDIHQWLAGECQQGTLTCDCPRAVSVEYRAQYVPATNPLCPTPRRGGLWH